MASLTIIMASIGGHKYEWSAHKKYLFSEATKYSLANSIGVLLSALYSDTIYPACFFIIGSLCFSGPIMYKCFTDSNALSKFAPIGGIAMILGWGLLAIL